MAQSPAFTRRRNANAQIRVARSSSTIETSASCVPGSTRSSSSAPRSGSEATSLTAPRPLHNPSAAASSRNSSRGTPSLSAYRSAERPVARNTSWYDGLWYAGPIARFHSHTHASMIAWSAFNQSVPASPKVPVMRARKAASMEKSPRFILPMLPVGTLSSMRGCARAEEWE